MQRRTILSTLLGSALVTRHALTGTAWAQEAAWPTRAIKMIVPFAPGGASAAGARLSAQELSRALDQPVYVENIGGAGGTVGIRQVARARADGYTIGYGHVGTLALAPLIYPNPGYDPLKDLTLLGQIGSVENILIVLPNSPYKSVSDIIDASRRKPGGLNYGSAGVGTSNHVSGALLSTLTGIPLNHVPYKGSAPAHQDILAGQVDMMFDNIPGPLGLMKGGKVKGIAVTSKERHPAVPDKPTIAEFLPGFEISSWGGVCGPANLPPAMVEKLSALTKKALDTPTVKKAFEQQGATNMWLSPQDTAAYRANDEKKLAPIIKASGAKVE